MKQRRSSNVVRHEKDWMPGLEERCVVRPVERICKLREAKDGHIDHSSSAEDELLRQTVPLRPRRERDTELPVDDMV
jgi:hypothetical protein